MSLIAEGVILRDVHSGLAFDDVSGVLGLNVRIFRVSIPV
jgi:hypothetical protein